MRISVPTIPLALHSSAKSLQTTSPAVAIECISSFLSRGPAAVLTGAGVSVDSGIRAYRGKDGRYMNPNYTPILYHELVDKTEKGHAFRQRYWLRSYLGYPPVRDALPNTTHYAIAALQQTGFVSKLITQNVDGLHQKALADIWDSSRIKEHVLELHGTLHKVRCQHGHVIDRDSFQEWLSAANPPWKAFVDDLEKSGNQPRTNPDGDVALEGVSYETFAVPECPSCLLEGRRSSVHKPEVIFFGESIPQDVKDNAFHIIEQADRLLILGTTLATYSAYRLLKQAVELKKPVLHLNLGPSRADGVDGVEKIELPTGALMPEVVKALLGADAADPVIQKLLNSGVFKPPSDEDDRSPRAAG